MQRLNRDFLHVVVAVLAGPTFVEAVIGTSVWLICPTSIFVANQLAPHLLGGHHFAVAYSYMALVPIIQPVAIKLVTTKEERKIRMTYHAGRRIWDD